MKKQIILLGMFCCIAFSAFNVYAASTDSVDIHGFISQGYLASDKNNYMANTEDGSFDFNEFGINFSTELDKLRVGIQVLSRDLGDSGNNEPTIDWAFGDYHLSDEFGIQFGKVKMPVGLYNQERDVDLLRVPILLPGSVYDEAARNNQNSYQGAGIYGVLNSATFGMFDYDLFYGNFQSNDDSVYVRGQISNLEYMATMLAGGIPITISNFTTSNEYIAGAALDWSTPVDGLRLAYSYSQIEAGISAEATNPTNTSVNTDFLMDVKKRATTVASLEYTFNDLTLACELSRTDVDVVMSLPEFAMSEVSTSKSEGWYVQSTYRFSDLIAAGVYYSEYYPDRTDKEGNSYAAVGLSHWAYQKEIVPTIRLDVTDNLTVKGEVHFVDGAAQVYGFNNPDGKEKDWTLYALKATLSF